MGAYPFHPLRDSLIGQSLLQLWSELGKDEESLLQLIQESFPNRVLPSEVQEANTKQDLIDTGFYYTPNFTKELMYQIVPDQIRKWIQEKNYHLISELLIKISNGTWEGQKFTGLDVALELLEWLLSGFEDRDIFYKTFIGLFPEFGRFFSEEQVKEGIWKHYRTHFS